MTHGILAQLFIGSHKSSLLSPVNKHLGVRHYYSYEVGLATWHTREMFYKKKQQQQQKDKMMPLQRPQTWPNNVHSVKGVVPVNCLRAQTLGAQEHSECRRSLSSPEQCTRLGTAWRCASSCRWCAVSHSERSGQGQRTFYLTICRFTTICLSTYIWQINIVPKLVEPILGHETLTVNY